MKLHASVIKHLINQVHLWADGDEEKKLTKKLSQLDLSVYTRQAGDSILVLSEELNRAKNQ
jgi:hypothetical protein